VNAFLIQQDITERVERQFGSYSDTIIKAAQETQKLTTVGDEQYMKLAVQAQNFGIANENVNKTVQDSIGLAEMFKDAGYETAHIGKWHLGHAEDKQPNAQGFDYYFGTLGANDNGQMDFYENNLLYVHSI